MAIITFGATAGNWSTGTLWVGGSAPGTGDIANFELNKPLKPDDEYMLAMNIINELLHEKAN